MFSADTGLGKTMFGVALAFAAHLGSGFLHWSGRRAARVLFVDGEMPRDLMQERLALACQWFDVEPPTDGLFFLSREDIEDMPPLDTDDGQKWLDAFIDRIGGVDLIVFDSLMCLCAGSLKEEDGWLILKPYVLGLTKRRIGQLWVHHVGHDKSRGYGIKSREWQMDTVMVGEKVELNGADVAFKLSFTKARRRKPSNREDFGDIRIELREGHWSSAPAEEDADDQAPGAAAGRHDRARPASPRRRRWRRADAHEQQHSAGPTRRPESLWRDRCYLAGIS